MVKHNADKGSSLEQKQQSGNKKAGAAPEESGFDKKLDGPNRPST
ncbi:MAG: hypothetical protein ACE3L7_09275 [Candidatus Pristimantibacillus sp.]